MVLAQQKKSLLLTTGLMKKEVLKDTKMPLNITNGVVFSSARERKKWLRKNVPLLFLKYLRNIFYTEILI